MASATSRRPSAGAAGIGQVQVRRAVERVAVGAETYHRLLRSSALHIQHVVDHDAVEPGAEAAAPLERREPGQGFEEDLLRRVLGVLRVVEHADRDVVDPSLMPPDEVLERLAIAGAGARDEGEVLGRSGRCRRRG